MSRRHLRTALIAGGIVILAVLVVILVTRSLGSNNSDVAERDPDAVQTPSSSTRATAVPAPSGGSVDETVAPAPPAKTYSDRKAKNIDIPGEVEVHLVSLKQHKNPEAIGPGALAGPVIVVNLRINNKQADPIDMDGVAVTLQYGDDQVGTPVQSELGEPFSGTLAPGEDALGAYVFSVPDKAGKSFTILVQYGAGKGIARFQT